jgi:hypothetical protein
MLSELSEKWENEQWINYNKVTNTYDSAGKQLSALYEYWENGQWITSQRKVYSYDKDENITSYLNEFWENGNWVEAERKIYTYNQMGLILDYLYEFRDEGLLMQSFRYTYTYDEKGNVLSEIHKELIDNKWANVDIYFGFTDSRANELSYFGFRIEATYKDSSPVVEDIFNPNLTLDCSPNPSSGTINLSYTLPEPANTSISISNMSGVEMAKISKNQMQLPGNYSASYDMSRFPQGVYFITIKAGNMTETRKIIINY